MLLMLAAVAELRSCWRQTGTFDLPSRCSEWVNTASDYYYSCSRHALLHAVCNGKGETMDLVESLISQFEDCSSFCENTPSAGWELHIHAIQLRERFHSVVDTVDDDEFSIALIGVTLYKISRSHCDD